MFLQVNVLVFIGLDVKDARIQRDPVSGFQLHVHVRVQISRSFSGNRSLAVHLADLQEPVILLPVKPEEQEQPHRQEHGSRDRDYDDLFFRQFFHFSYPVHRLRTQTDPRLLSLYHATHMPIDCPKPCLGYPQKQTILHQGIYVFSLA